MDLRWGISEKAVHEQRIIEICLKEIKHCQQVSPKPNFILLMGDRYGWKPLPSHIPWKQFEDIRRWLKEFDIEKECKILLEEWYKIDENSMTEIYVLQPRTGKYKEWDIWKSIEGKIRRILSDAKKGLGWSEETENDYFKSATEHEIIEGVLNPPEGMPDIEEHIFCFFRKITNIKDLRKEQKKDYIDLDDKGNHDLIAYEQLMQLKQKLRKRLPNNIYDYEIKCKEEGITTDHLSKLCEDVEKSLSKVILKELNTLKEMSELDREIENHTKFGKERASFFTGRTSIIEKILDYIKGNCTYPLVIHGQPGSGKTSLLARVTQLIPQSIPEAVLITRFIGITPDSSTDRRLLESIITHQNQVLNKKEDFSIPNDFDDLVKVFKKSLTSITKDKPLVIILDALNQLLDTDDSQNLNWLPVKLPKNIKLIVSTISGRKLNILRKKIPENCFLELKQMQSEAAKKLLEKWMKAQKPFPRTLTPQQRKIIYQKLEKNRLPLYLKLVLEKVRMWKSYTKQEEISLSSTAPAIIRALLTQLEMEHGQKLVSHSLAYIATTRNGLAEDELLDILSEDKEVFTEFKDRAHHDQPEKDRLPVVVWSRFFFDLEPYMAEHSADNKILINFFHSQFGEVVKETYLVEQFKEKILDNISVYFANKPLFLDESQQILNLRKLSELPYSVSFLSKNNFQDNIEKHCILDEANKCLITISKSLKVDLGQHINEIEPIINHFSSLNNTEAIISLTDSLIPVLEEQCSWLAIENLLNLTIKGMELKEREDRRLTYLYGLSRILLHRGKYNNAIEKSEQALILAKEQKNLSMEVDILWHIGTALRFIGEAEKAIRYIEKVDSINLNDNAIKIKCLITRGITEHGMGHFKEALELYNQSEILFTKKIQSNNDKLTPHSKNEIMGMLNIRGSLGYHTDNFSLAKKSWELMLKFAKETNSKRDIKNAKAKLSLINPNLDLLEVKQNWEEILYEHIKRGEIASTITTYGELAEICFRRREVDEAKNLCKKAIDNSEEIDNLHADAGKAYIQGILAAIEGNIEEARVRIKASEKLFAQWTSPYRYWVRDTLKRMKPQKSRN